MWNIQAADLMKVQQDTLGKPLSRDQKVKAVRSLKTLGVTHVPLSVPYDSPPGFSDATQQNTEWVQVIREAGLKVWHRHSWCSDEGWYGVPKIVSNNRIKDTVDWMNENLSLIRPGDIFTPKPEPQNMGVVGMNGNGNRFKSVAEFNKWIRDMALACRQVLSISLSSVKVGYWGFDGFVTVGFNNPDWQGKSFLEKATVEAMEDGICVDHYPPNGTTMADFIKVFKQVWPGKNLIIGEYGAKGLDEAGVKAQIIQTFETLKNEPMVTGVNYWPAFGGGDAPLLDSNFDPILSYETVKSYFLSFMISPDISVGVVDNLILEEDHEYSPYIFYKVKVNGEIFGRIKVYKNQV